MASPRWIHQMLKQRGVPFAMCHHAEAFTAQEVAQREHISGHQMAKVVVVIADDRPVELVLPASRHVDLDHVKAVIPANDVRLAEEDELEDYFPDCDLGAMPPLRHWEDVDIFMDESLQGKGEILFQAGSHTEAVRLQFEDWFSLVKPTIASFAEPVGRN